MYASDSTTGGVTVLTVTPRAALSEVVSAALMVLTAASAASKDGRTACT